VDFLFCDLYVDFYRRHLVHHEGFSFLSNGSFSPGSAFAVFIIAGAIAAIDSAAIIAMMANIVFDCSYDIDGFQIPFFTEKQIQDLASAEGFEIL
jgi:hypothetical protein